MSHYLNTRVDFSQLVRHRNIVRAGGEHVVVPHNDFFVL